MKPLGLILIGVGILALIYSGFKYTTDEKVVDLGPVKIDKEKKHNVNWPPITGVLLLLGGVIMLAVDKKK
ncbi:MAG TPA: hypothetical protein VNW06_01720 [Cytophagaceae bacterium]|jgi:hypothetical protein|nr:hypothetical protein [Cytophagaceae bacterium]